MSPSQCDVIIDKFKKTKTIDCFGAHILLAKIRRKLGPEVMIFAKQRIKYEYVLQHILDVGYLHYEPTLRFIRMCSYIVFHELFTLEPAYFLLKETYEKQLQQEHDTDLIDIKKFANLFEKLFEPGYDIEENVISLTVYEKLGFLDYMWLKFKSTLNNYFPELLKFQSRIHHINEFLNNKEDSRFDIKAYIQSYEKEFNEPLQGLAKVYLQCNYILWFYSKYDRTNPIYIALLQASYFYLFQEGFEEISKNDFFILYVEYHSTIHKAQSENTNLAESQKFIPISLDKKQQSKDRIPETIYQEQDKILVAVAQDKPCTSSHTPVSTDTTTKLTAIGASSSSKGIGSVGAALACTTGIIGATTAMNKITLRDKDTKSQNTYPVQKNIQAVAAGDTCYFRPSYPGGATYYEKKEIDTKSEKIHLDDKQKSTKSYPEPVPEPEKNYLNKTPKFKKIYPTEADTEADFESAEQYEELHSGGIGRKLEGCIEAVGSSQGIKSIAMTGALLASQGLKTSMLNGVVAGGAGILSGTITVCMQGAANKNAKTKTKTKTNKQEKPTSFKQSESNIQQEAMQSLCSGARPATYYKIENQLENQPIISKKTDIGICITSKETFCCPASAQFTTKDNSIASKQVISKQAVPGHPDLSICKTSAETFFCPTKNQHLSTIDLTASRLVIPKKSEANTHKLLIKNSYHSSPVIHNKAPDKHVNKPVSSQKIMPQKSDVGISKVSTEKFCGLTSTHHNNFSFKEACKSMNSSSNVAKNVVTKLNNPFFDGGSKASLGGGYQSSSKKSYEGFTMNGFKNFNREPEPFESRMGDSDGNSYWED